MAVNKVEYAGKVLLDLTEDTVTENQLLEGAVAHDKTGAKIVGALIKIDTSKTFMASLHVYSTEILADLNDMEDNRAYLISCHGVKNVPVDGGAMVCSVGFSKKYVVQKFTLLEDNRTFVRTKNGNTFGAWKELQDRDSSNVATIESPYKGKTIVAFGDSIIAGWGWKEGTGIIQPLKEKYSDATWINKAESGANMAVTSNPKHTPIVTQIKNYTGAADAIIFDGGVNDINSSIPVGSIESGYDASYNTGTFCGALESALQYIMDTYPLATKLYIIPHSFAKDNSHVNSIYSKAIEICEKWNMPYLDMRKHSQIAMTAKNKSAYTKNANSGVGDGVHPVESWYRTFYSPIIDQKLRSLGIGYTTASVAPTVIAVTSVSLSKNTLSIKKGESAVLTATVKPSNATNQSVKWSTNNSNVTVSNGEVTGKAVGTSVVTVTTDDGGYTAQCTVNVAENIVEPSESHTEVKGY